MAMGIVQLHGRARLRMRGGVEGESDLAESLQNKNVSKCECVKAMFIYFVQTTRG